MMMMMKKTSGVVPVVVPPRKEQRRRTLPEVVWTKTNRIITKETDPYHIVNSSSSVDSIIFLLERMVSYTMQYYLPQPPSPPGFDCCQQNAVVVNQQQRRRRHKEQYYHPFPFLVVPFLIVIIFVSVVTGVVCASSTNTYTTIIAKPEIIHSRCQSMDLGDQFEKQQQQEKRNPSSFVRFHSHYRNQKQQHDKIRNVASTRSVFFRSISLKQQPLHDKTYNVLDCKNSCSIQLIRGGGSDETREGDNMNNNNNNNNNQNYDTNDNQDSGYDQPYYYDTNEQEQQQQQQEQYPYELSPEQQQQQPYDPDEYLYYPNDQTNLAYDNNNNNDMSNNNAGNSNSFQQPSTFVGDRNSETIEERTEQFRQRQRAYYQGTPYYDDQTTTTPASTTMTSTTSNSIVPTSTSSSSAAYLANSNSMREPNGRMKLIATASRSSRAVMFFVLMWRNVHLFEMADVIYRPQPIIRLFVVIPLCLAFIANLYGALVSTLSSPAGTIPSSTSSSSSSSSSGKVAKKRLKLILNFDKLIEMILLLYYFCRLTFLPSKLVHSRDMFIANAIHSIFFLIYCQAFTRLSWDEQTPIPELQPQPYITSTTTEEENAAFSFQQQQQQQQLEYQQQQQQQQYLGQQEEHYPSPQQPYQS